MIHKLQSNVQPKKVIVFIDQYLTNIFTDDGSGDVGDCEGFDQLPTLGHFRTHGTLVKHLQLKNFF